MLVCHQHRFIYIKTAKTASTSTEISLSRYCGPGDIVTPLNVEAESIRRKLGVYPQNYLAEWSEYGLYDFYKLVVRGRMKRRFSGHMKAHEIKARIPEEVWNSYFKFTFDRNPWDKTVSNYFWRCGRDRKPIEFGEYLQQDKDRFQHYNFPYYSIDGEVVVDFVGRYEQLQSEIANALRQVGVDFDGWMPRTKCNTKRNKRHYSEVMTEEQRDFIAEQFRAEIELLGYEYESRKAA